MKARELTDWALLKQSLQCCCPACGEGALYASRYSFDLLDSCESCGLDYTKNDIADGPAVFLIFILGFALVPLALWVEFTFTPPLWAHVILWSIITVGATLASLKPLKSYIFALQYKHSPQDWT